MIGLCRLWLKLLVALALVVGCNVAAPAMSAMSSQTMMTSDMPCHEHKGKGDALPTLCGKACLAIPATAPAIMPAMPVPAAQYAALLPVFTEQVASPDTPPPRAAAQA